MEETNYPSHARKHDDMTEMEPQLCSGENDSLDTAWTYELKSNGVPPVIQLTHTC